MGGEVRELTRIGPTDLLSGYLGSSAQGRANTVAEFQSSLCVCDPALVTSNELAVWAKYPALDAYFVWDSNQGENPSQYQGLPGYDPYVLVLAGRGVLSEGNTDLALVIALPVVVGVLLIAGFAFLAVFLKRRRVRQFGWLILKEELDFDDPPQILSRRADGEVVRAWYRSYPVAVVR